MSKKLICHVELNIGDNLEEKDLRYIMDKGFDHAISNMINDSGLKLEIDSDYCSLKGFDDEDKVMCHIKGLIDQKINISEEEYEMINAAYIDYALYSRIKSSDLASYISKLLKKPSDQKINPISVFWAMVALAFLVKKEHFKLL